MRLNNVFGLVEVNEGDHIGIYVQHGADITKATFTKIAAYSTTSHVLHTADDFAPAQKQRAAGELNQKHRFNRRNLADFTLYPETLPDPAKADQQEQEAQAGNVIDKAPAPEPDSGDADADRKNADDAYVTTYEAAYVAAGDGDELEADALKALQAEAAAAAQASLGGDRKMLPELAAEADYAAAHPVIKKAVDQKGGAA